jgi:hypothetical protein
MINVYIYIIIGFKIIIIYIFFIFINIMLKIIQCIFIIIVWRLVLVQPEVSVPIQPPSVVANWLRHILSLSNTDACPLEFNALNTRKNVYQSWHEVVGERKCEWSPKRISEALYRTFPRSRPIKGRREKLRGIAVIEIPSKSEFYDALEAFNVQPLRL